jgi:hypothetical protein
MEQDALISSWRGANDTPKNNLELKRMISEKSHPVLKRIRRQLLIEIIAFTVFLFVYYDFFDGNRKAVYVNVLLVSAILLVIVHNIIGYLMTKQQVKGDNIMQSLHHHLSKMKMYAVISVACRILMTCCLLFFFTSAIIFNANKYWILMSVIVIIIVQMALLSGIWFRRIRQIKGIINGLLG